MQKISALGLDVGRRRIGVAGCDGLGLMATGLTTIKRTSFDGVLAELKAIVIERDVRVLVVGLPYSMSGDLGSQAKETQKFATRLSEGLQLPVEFVDERLSSIEAKGLLSDRRRTSGNKAEIDRVAAALILQRWLDRRRHS